MNLHEWITARVEAVEAEHRSVVIIPNDGGMPIAGKITEAVPVNGGIELTVTPGEPVTPAVLRRCEADRRILARHRLSEPDEWLYPGCEGCDTTGHMDDLVTDNINDCPELLDLAHAHGITEADLAGLDRPQPQRHAKTAHTPSGARRIADLMATAPITTDDVPEALRGARWRRHRH